MSIVYEQLMTLIRQCIDALTAIRPRSGNLTKSPATCSDYLKLARSLLNRALGAEGGLAEIMPNTSRPTTFYKRLAALRYYCYVHLHGLMAALQQGKDESALSRLQPQLAQHLSLMQTLAIIRQQGLTAERGKRRSKRQALPGLPSDWRDALYRRSQNGKYAAAILVGALTGSRPSELQRGVKIWRGYDEKLGRILIHFHLQGTKVKGGQGQPNRFIAYKADDIHPLVVVMNQLLDAQPEQSLFVQVANAGNFSAEVRRLACGLWPRHKHSVTAYCFRHQWSADAKQLDDPDAVSRGLGHLSAKTRRQYGTAGQSSALSKLCPIRIEAERPVKAFTTPASEIELQPPNESS